MKVIKGSRVSKFLAYFLVGSLLFYLNLIEISYSQEPSAEDFLTQGKSLYIQGDYALSLEKLHQAESYIKLSREASKPEPLGEVYFYQGLNYARQGDAEAAKAMFIKALAQGGGRTFDASLMDEAAKGFFKEARLEFEKSSGPRAMGVAGEPAGGSTGKTLAWIVAGVVLVAAAGLAVYFLFIKKGYGDIHVESEPTGAKVFLDGSDTGKVTACNLTDVREGTHKLKLVKEYFGEWEGDVEVKKKETVNVSVTLKGYKYEYVSSLWIPDSAGHVENMKGVAVDSSRNVYVLDATIGGHGYVSKFLPSGSFVYRKDIGWEFWYGPAVDSYNNVYTTETHTDKVYKYQDTGSTLNLVTSWGGPGSGNSEFNDPQAVDSKSAYVYVADTKNNRIQKFTTTGSYSTKWGTYGSGDGQLIEPQGIAVDPAGYVYVADTGNYRVQKFTTAGGFVAKWGSQGSSDGQFGTIRGIDVDLQGAVYVADYSNTRVQKFTATGGYLTQFRPNYGAPRDVAVDSQGNVYVMFVSLSNTPIEKWKMTSSTLAKVKIFYSGKTAGSSAGLLFHGATSVPSRASKKTPAENISQRQTEQESKIKN
jgi:hypothetical protein